MIRHQVVQVHALDSQSEVADVVQVFEDDGELGVVLVDVRLLLEVVGADLADLGDLHVFVDHHQVLLSERVLVEDEGCEHLETALDRVVHAEDRLTGGDVAVLLLHGELAGLLPLEQ